jgi:hypothetical protein
MSDIGFPKHLVDNLQDKKISRKPVDWEKEIVDMDEGWIYERKKNKKGKKLRKFFETLRAGYENRIFFWKPKINDLVVAEAKRWKAIEYRQRQITPLLKVFELVRDNAPFSCVHITNNWPEHSWVEFCKPNDDSGNIGISWNWTKGNGPSKNFPHKQKIGDAWFAYEMRSAEVRHRASHFEEVFRLALEKRYSFYNRDIYNQTKILIINGRQYILGRAGSGYGYGVVAYPEDIVTETVK